VRAFILLIGNVFNVEENFIQFEQSEGCNTD
jgi:hypothetical protein